jgi:ribonuclease-3
MTIEEFKQQNTISSNNPLFEQAFIHRSFINENPKTGLIHNERLEFLGDAVLELISTEFLYEQYPHHNEGDLTAYRSALVNAVTLGDVATSLGFNDMMKLSKGEAKDVHRARSSILADAYEAFIGALYLDQGYEASKVFITRTLLTTLPGILESGSWMDPKSHLQELSQSVENHTPVYKVLDEEGPDHDKIFTIGVFVNGKLRGKGQGPSKQIGQQSAAEEALTYYKAQVKSGRKRENLLVIDNREDNL